MRSLWHYARGSFCDVEQGSTMQKQWGAVQASTLDRIARRNGLHPPSTWPEPWTGATSRVWPCGKVVIKIALESPEAERAVMIDAAMNPVARSTGVRIPALLAVDDRCDILPLPYAIYERVPEASSLDVLRGYPQREAHAWEEAGRNLALVHQVAYETPLPFDLREFRQHPGVDPRTWAEELACNGRIDAEDSVWLMTLLDMLAPHAQMDVPLTLCHGDANASNVLFSSEDRSTIWLIDWSGAGWLDPVWDAAAIPLDVVPALMRGHREIAPFPHDETADARVLWCQLQTRLLNARMERDDRVARARLRNDIDAARRFSAGQAWG
jgi:aminoglycoside phosphotransferase (APT) family kinase protein